MQVGPKSCCVCLVGNFRSSQPFAKEELVDGNQFDRVTKWMSTRRTRRETVRALVGGALSGAAVVAGSENALAGKPPKPPKPGPPDCCPTSAPTLCGLM